MPAHLNLHHGSDGWHDDRDRDTEAAAVVGQRQGVVAGASSYHALHLLLLHIDTFIQSETLANRQIVGNVFHFSKRFTLPVLTRDSTWC